MELRVAIEPGPELEITALHFDERGLAPKKAIDDTALAGDVFVQLELEFCSFRLELPGKASPATLFVQILGHDRRLPLEDSRLVIRLDELEPWSLVPAAAGEIRRERTPGRECGARPPDPKRAERPE